MVTVAAAAAATAAEAVTRNDVGRGGLLVALG
jgi:hypothetical protein